MRSFIRRLHQTRAATADDIATHLSQFSGEFFHSIVSRYIGLQPGRAENGHAIILARGATKPRQIINDFPQASHRTFKKFNRRILVVEANDIGLSEGGFLIARVAHPIRRCALTFNAGPGLFRSSFSGP